MGNVKHPRHGSMQFWPHVRASRLYARTRTWPNNDQSKLLGFMGYKAGMTHLIEEKIDTTSPTKKTMLISTPVTIIECPPMLPLAIRFYQDTPYGKKIVADVQAQKFEKELSRKIKPTKKKTAEPKEFDDVRLLVYTQPKKTGLPNKKPEIIELGVGGKTVQDKLNYAKSLLDKEIKITDVFKPGQMVDTKSISRGQGYQGPVKIYGVKIRQHKSEKTKRGPGSLGAWKAQGKITYRVAHARKHGFHQRTEHNKLLMKISSKPDEINAKGGFSRFGFVKNEYALVKGSVAGPAKRPIILTEAIRPNRRLKAKDPKIIWISTESQQGL